MIKYNLKCENNHEFESWFSDSSEFERLRKKKLLECILCPSKNIKKSIMAPIISVPNVLDKNDDFSEKDFLKEKNRLKEIRSFIEKNFEYVGKNFSKRVREIYYDKKSQKAIYGNTTPEEREELAEEGIDLLSVPWVSKDN